MKLPCKVVEDILPMYYDKICSEESTALVEEHLKDCPFCSRMLANLRCSFSIPEKTVDDIKPLKKLQKSYNRTNISSASASTSPAMESGKRERHLL